MLGVALRVSSTFTALTEKAGAFCVNVLGRYQTDLATHFADPLRPTGDAQFHNLTWHPDPHTGAPLMTGACPTCPSSPVNCSRWATTI
nr:flavin reductase family protein [Salinispora arenicola]